MQKFACPLPCPVCPVPVCLPRTCLFAPYLSVCSVRLDRMIALRPNCSPTCKPGEAYGQDQDHVEPMSVELSESVWVVGKIRTEPSFGFFDGDTFSLRVAFDLVSRYSIDGKVACIWVAEI